MKTFSIINLLLIIVLVNKIITYGLTGNIKLTNETINTKTNITNCLKYKRVNASIFKFAVKRNCLDADKQRIQLKEGYDDSWGLYFSGDSSNEINLGFSQRILINNNIKQVNGLGAVKNAVLIPRDEKDIDIKNFNNWEIPNSIFNVNENQSWINFVFINKSYLNRYHIELILIYILFIIVVLYNLSFFISKNSKLALDHGFKN